MRSPRNGAAVAPVQMGLKDCALMEMMTQLMARMDRLEESSKHGYSRRNTPRTASRVSDQEVKLKVVVCFRCGQEGYLARGYVQPRRSSNQGN